MNRSIIIRKHIRQLAALVLAPALLIMTACGSNAPVPTEAMAVAEAAVQRANTSATREHAPAELQIATAKLASARDAVNQRQYERARNLAQQAELDAQVAETRAQAIRANIAAREAQEAARDLREEITR